LLALRPPTAADGIVIALAQLIDDTLSCFTDAEKVDL